MSTNNHTLDEDRLDKDQLIHALGAAIVANPEVASVGWDQYALVARFEPGLRQMNGFAYAASGAVVSATPSGIEVHELLKQLREATQLEGKESWTACIVRIDRATGKIRVEFEYDAAEQWRITPATAGDVAERARPPAHPAA